MRKAKRFKNLSFLLTVLLDILLFVAVFFLMNYVQRLLDSDVRINLAEIVTQNKDVITSKLKLEMNNLTLDSKQIADRFAQTGKDDKETFYDIFINYTKEKGEQTLSCATTEGEAIFPDGQQVDISGRRYFRLAMEGRANISERTVSRLTGEDIFVISVPMMLQGKTIGTVQKQYTPQEMYDLCSVSLFSEQGDMYIINSQGYILISSQQDQYSRESDNFYWMTYLTNPDASKKLEEDIQSGQGGFMETDRNGQKMFSAYTPIDEIYDWYLISSVATNAVSPNAAIVIRLFYFILLAVVLVFAFSLIYYLTMKHRQQANLERVAFVDTVTGGDTYTKFTMDLQERLYTQGEDSLHIFAFDIDNFKYINSFYSFDAGDHILKEIYGLYKKKLNPKEMIARVTGDHFVMLLEDASEERLKVLFGSELTIDGIKIYLSAGLYPITNPAESVNLMMDKANMAEQKNKGMRNKQVEVYSEEYDRQMIENEQMKRSVELALADDEIIPFFQPKVDVNTRALVGAEALARWRQKDGKLVPPGAFVPICEKTGQIVQIDMTIFEKTLQFIRRNLDKGVSCVPISVNFSRMHLLNQEFVHTLLDKLQAYKVPPELIELELTETVIFDNYEMIEAFINELHKYGLQISMDDFGSGYSSLHMLKDVEIDVLKIDRGFLLDTADSDRQKTIFSAIAEMARNLRMKVVVEGVETLENVALMKEFGCSIAQGYYFAKPMDEELFQKAYEEGKL